jgi:hypothetical protein
MLEIKGERKKRKQPKLMKRRIWEKEDKQREKG